MQVVARRCVKRDFSRSARVIIVAMSFAFVHKQPRRTQKTDRKNDWLVYEERSCPGVVHAIFKAIKNCIRMRKETPQTTVPSVALHFFILFYPKIICRCSTWEKSRWNLPLNFPLAFNAAYRYSRYDVARPIICLLLIFRRVKVVRQKNFLQTFPFLHFPFSFWERNFSWPRFHWTPWVTPFFKHRGRLRQFHPRLHWHLTTWHLFPKSTSCVRRKWPLQSSSAGRGGEKSTARRKSQI